MKKLLLLTLLLSFTIPFSAYAEEKQSAYDRVMKSGKIKCGYGVSSPYIYSDLNTGEMKGLNVEIMNEVAKALGFSLDWSEETGWADLPTALNTGRVDVACSLLWTDPQRGKQVSYTKPVYYSAIHLFMAEGDERFTGKWGEINHPDVKIAVQEGDVNYNLAKRYFPKAQLVTLPASTSSWAEVYLNVTTKKADLTLADSVAIKNFNKNNEVKLKKVPLGKPVAVYGTSLAVSIKEPYLKEVLNTTVLHLQDTGKIDALIKKFDQKYPGAVIPVAKPYEAQK